MSLTGNIQKISSDVKHSINQIARQGLTDINGIARGARKIVGYVCAIHEDGDLAGTIDVQEYNYEPDEYIMKGTGHHAGVLLSAVQSNKEGHLIVPMLYSDVMIVQNPIDGHEYVIMYSHVQKMRYTAHSEQGKDDGEIEIGVTEVEPFHETDDGLDKDYYELDPTKNKTSTHYNSTSIVDHIISPEDEEGFRQEKTVAHKIITVGDSKITIDGQNVLIETSGKVDLKVGNTTITEEDGKVTVTSDDVKVDCSNCEVNGSTITLTGGTLNVKGTSATDLNGPFNAVKVCPFSGAPHCGSSVSGT